MKKYIKSYTADELKAQLGDNYPQGGYLYILKHGIGPGTIPRDVTVVKTKDLPNYYTAVWLDRFLSADELKEYDIPSETDINKYLGRINYCQKNGDVVPCDDVKESTSVKAATKTPKFETLRDEDGVYGYKLGNWYLMKIYSWGNSYTWYIFDKPTIHLYDYEKSKMGPVGDGHEQGYVHNLKEGKQILIDRYLAENGEGNVQACGQVTAAVKTHPKIPTGWNRVSEGDDDNGNWTTISKELPNNDGYYWIDLYEDDNGKKYYEIQAGYRTSDGSISDVSMLTSKQFYRLGDAVKFAEDKIIRDYDKDIDACDKVTASTSPEGLGLEPRQRTAIDGKTWWVVYDTVTNKYLDTILYFGKYKTKKACQYAIDKAIEQYGDRLSRTIHNHRKYFSNPSVDDKVTGSTKYMANMVSASSSDSAYDENDEPYKYYVAGYYSVDSNGHPYGLAESLYTNDFDEALETAHTYCGNGDYVEFTNQITGMSLDYDPDDWEEATSYGDYPTSVYDLY